METDKEELESAIKISITMLGVQEYDRITAQNDEEEEWAIKQTGFYQNQIMKLEKQYRELGGNRNDR